MNEKAEKILADSALRKTAVRLSALQILLGAGDRALGNGDFERGMADVDRITLYRTLRTFEQKGIIHQVIDGNGAAKYALCAPGCSEHAHHDAHVHFHCEHCGDTTCLDDVRTPSISMPTGYQTKDVQVLLRGLCKGCNEA